MNKLTLLQDITFGHRIAEEEREELARYFVQTDQWRRLVDGSVDIIYGTKGSGKSALYSLLLDNSNALAGKRIHIIPAELLRGQPAFSSLQEDPPTSETEFVNLWKFYILSLIGHFINDKAATANGAQALLKRLRDAGLLNESGNLKAKLAAARVAVRQLISRIETETGYLWTDPSTGDTHHVYGKITLKEPSPTQRRDGFLSVDDVLTDAEAIIAGAGLRIWVALDRLDVAFSTSPSLERNALRALFKAYLDLRGLRTIHLKIFLRDDIWRRISETGFREASHITRTQSISWDSRGLQNLLIRRLLANDSLVRELSIDSSSILSDLAQQDALFYRVFPAKVEQGDRRPTTLDWMLSRTADGTKATAPRELIHLATEALAEQIRLLELGSEEPPGDILISGAALKAALAAVSKARLEQTLYPEHHDLKQHIERLEGQKTEHTVDSLRAIWGIDATATSNMADRLVDVGFFEKRGRDNEITYWVPFLYRDALSMIQGRSTDA